jgi:hypothetical protein
MANGRFNTTYGKALSSGVFTRPVINDLLVVDKQEADDNAVREGDVAERHQKLAGILDAIEKKKQGQAAPFEVELREGDPEFLALTRVLKARPSKPAIPTTEVAISKIPFEAELGPDGRSGWVNIDIPEGTSCFNLSFEGDRAALFQVVDLVDPNGRVLTKTADDDPEKPFAMAKQTLNPTTPESGFAAMQVPNNPDIVLAPGEYRFRVRGLDYVTNAPASGRVSGEIVVRNGPPPDRARLRLNIHSAYGTIKWTDGTLHDVWTAEKLATNQHFQAAIAEVRRLYAAVGIEIEVNPVFHDLEDPDRAFSEVDSLEGKDSELSRLFQRGQDDAPGLNLFLVQNIRSTSPNTDIDGVAPISAPAALRSGRQLGVVVEATSDTSLGGTLAHEIAHMLGLFHTTEFDGKTEDPIADTPKGSEGRKNVLFPATQPKAGSFTEGQGKVMRSSFLLEPIDTRAAPS